MKDTLSDFIKYVEKIKFKKILEEDFMSDGLGIEKEARKEKFYCYWHYKHSIFLMFDSYSWFDEPNKSVNSGTFYYNVKFDSSKHNYWISSGHWCELSNGEFAWAGYHDVRDGVDSVIKGLLEKGEFLTKWVDSPVGSICHHGDWRINGYSFGENTHSDIVTKKRIKLFPIEIQYKMGFMNLAEFRAKKLENIFEK